MKQNEFKINFNMPIPGSNITIPMTAIAELHHSDPYYLLRSIEIVSMRPGGEMNAKVIKEFKIRQVKDGDEKLWVHCDTGRESELSRSAGLAIEQYAGDLA